MIDRDRVLQRLRQGPVHSIELHRKGITGNPSQRISELEDLGYDIDHASAPWTPDGGGRKRPGTIYTLKSEPDLGLGAGTAGSLPPPPAPVDDTADEEPASAEPEAVAEPQLFDTVDIDIPAPAPSAYDHDAD